IPEIKLAKNLTRYLFCTLCLCLLPISSNFSSSQDHGLNLQLHVWSHMLKIDSNCNHIYFTSSMASYEISTN
ncbi:hypothetical protein L9F63_008067, partial [Diploptera punctata]